MGYGIWDMGYGIWDMGYGIGDLALIVRTKGIGDLAQLVFKSKIFSKLNTFDL